MTQERHDEISEPSAADWTWLEQAERKAEDLFRAHYGEVALKHDAGDLELAQRLIVDDILAPDDLLELQCLGVVLGNVFVSNTSMQWVRIRNEFGDMLAVHSPVSRFTLYPVTMVSKRMEQGREIDIPGLYRSFVADLAL